MKWKVFAAKPAVKGTVKGTGQINYYLIYSVPFGSLVSILNQLAALLSASATCCNEWWAPQSYLCFSQILDQQEKVIWVSRAWIKIEMLIEAPCLIVLGMNYDRADTGNISSLERSGKSIMQ